MAQPDQEIEMKLIELLTTEELKTKFNSDFELVNYAIRLAENIIKSGKELNLDPEVLNLAYQILQMILQGKDELIDLSSDAEAAQEDATRDAILRRVEEARQSLADADVTLG